MQIVINIDKAVYKVIKETVQMTNRHLGRTMMLAHLMAVINEGTPLPKRHGRLIDADEALKAMDTWDKFGFEHTGLFVRNPEDDFIKYVHYDDMVKSVSGAETIIEADKEADT